VSSSFLTDLRRRIGGELETGAALGGLLARPVGGEDERRDMEGGSEEADVDGASFIRSIDCAASVATTDDFRCEGPPPRGDVGTDEARTLSKSNPPIGLSSLAFVRGGGVDADSCLRSFACSLSRRA